MRAPRLAPKIRARTCGAQLWGNSGCQRGKARPRLSHYRNVGRTTMRVSSNILLPRRVQHRRVPVSIAAGSGLADLCGCATFIPLQELWLPSCCVKRFLLSPVRFRTVNWEGGASLRRCEPGLRAVARVFENFTAYGKTPMNWLTPLSVIFCV